MSLAPGSRFQQLQPVQGHGTGGQDGTASPYTLLTVPDGATYHLRYTHCSLSLVTDSTFATVGGFGTFASVQDSNGTLYAECECFVAGPDQVSNNGAVLPTDNAVLDAGATLILVVTHGTGAVTGFYVRVGGGGLWRTG
jgi:hypothetical protein